MTENLIIKGHWEGYFVYGQGYGGIEDKVKFRLILEDIGNGKFHGKCIELEGKSLNPGIAKIDGFVEASFISFTKEYPKYFKFDDYGNQVEMKSKPKPLISYMGNYDWATKLYSGKWEILSNNDNGKFVLAGSGLWSMKKI